LRFFAKTSRHARGALVSSSNMNRNIFYIIGVIIVIIVVLKVLGLF
jgi:hypothetical protein